MAFRPADKTLRWIIKPIIFMICLSPFVFMMWLAFNDGLGSNPVEALTHRTGDWTLRFLLITLLVTPIRQITQWVWLIKLRRMFGLYAFFYGFLHFITYIWFDQSFDLADILIDIPKRPFITIGFTAFILLIPLALTSTNKMMKRLGKRWKKLHRLAYLVPTLGILHFMWLVKADLREPTIYFMLLLILFAYRIWKSKIRKS